MLIIDGFEIYGLLKDRCVGVIIFNLVDIYLYDVVIVVDIEGVVVCVGYYCV